MSRLVWGMAMVSETVSVTTASGVGVGISGILRSGTIGAIGSTGAGGNGSGNGPTGSARAPVSPSGTEEGAATGSEKTGSVLVLFVMSSIAFCRSLSTVGFWFILCPPLLYLC